MATSLLDGLKGLVTPDLLSTAARNLGESEASVGAGLGASFPTILAGLAGKAGNAQAMRPFFDIISSPANDGSVLRDPRLAVTATPGTPLGAAGAQLLSGLFGPQLSSVGDVVGRSSGLRSGAGGSLLGLAAPLVLGVLGNRVRSGGLNPAGLASMLLGERDQITRALPAGLASIPGLASILGAKEVGRTADIAAPPVSAARSRWLWPALAALALVAVLWGVSRNRPSTAVEETVGTVKGAVTDAGDTLAAAATDMRFRCGDQSVTLGHIGDRTVLTTDVGTFDVRLVKSGSGAKYEAYTDASTTFWNKGDRAMLAIKGKPYPECARER